MELLENFSQNFLLVLACRQRKGHYCLVCAPLSPLIDVWQRGALCVVYMRWFSARGWARQNIVAFPFVIQTVNMLTHAYTYSPCLAVRLGLYLWVFGFDVNFNTSNVLHLVCFPAPGLKMTSIYSNMEPVCCLLYTVLSFIIKRNYLEHMAAFLKKRQSFPLMFVWVQCKSNEMNPCSSHFMQDVFFSAMALCVVLTNNPNNLSPC